MAPVIQPADVRSRLREALELDLVGPGAGNPLADERLPGWVRPSNWYLTGFLVPRGAPAEQRADADADDDFDPEVAVEGGLGDDSTEDRRSAKKSFFPSSMGLSFLVAEGVERLDVTVRWGDYRYVEDAPRDDGRTDDAPDSGESSDGTDGAADGAVVKSEGKASTRWQRRAREETVPVTLAAAGDPYQEPVPGSRGLILHVVARPVSATTFAGRIPPGTRSVSLFLVNGRPPQPTPPATRHSPSKPSWRCGARFRSCRVPTRVGCLAMIPTNAWQVSTMPTHTIMRPVTAWPRTGSC